MVILANTLLNDSRYRGSHHGAENIVAKNKYYETAILFNSTKLGLLAKVAPN